MPARIATACALAAAAAIAVLGVTAVPALALVAAAAASTVPFAARARRARADRRSMHDALPVLLDRLASGMHAGQSLQAAFIDAAVSADGPLAAAVRACASDIRATSDLRESLRQCALRLDDEVADRALLAIRAVADIPGSASSAVLRAAAAQVRKERAAQAEVDARRSWVSASAGVAVCAPWITVAALALRGESLRAYASASGSVVILVAAMLCGAGYASMRLIGRAARPPRVVRR